MANLHVDKDRSAHVNLNIAFERIGTTLSTPRYGSEYNASGVCIRATHESYGFRRRFKGIQLWVEDVRYKKIIRRVMTSSDGTLDLDKLKAKFEELKAMVPALERQKEERNRAYREDNEDMERARTEEDALVEEVGLLGLGGLDHRRAKDSYKLTLTLQTPDEVRQVVAYLKEIRGITEQV